METFRTPVSKKLFVRLSEQYKSMNIKIRFVLIRFSVKDFD